MGLKGAATTKVIWPPYWSGRRQLVTGPTSSGAGDPRPSPVRRSPVIGVGSMAHQHAAGRTRNSSTYGNQPVRLAQARLGPTRLGSVWSDSEVDRAGESSSHGQAPWLNSLLSRPVRTSYPASRLSLGGIPDALVFQRTPIQSRPPRQRK